VNECKPLPIGEEGGMALAEMLRVNKTLLDLDVVGRCRLAVSNPVLKLESAHGLSA
jgi:hypothetical protein